MPWISIETIVMKKTMLKIWSEPGMSATTVNIAKMIGVAPLSPTHEMNTLALNESLLNGRSEMNTASGRPTKVMNIPISRATGATESISLGLTSSPSVRNIPICISHVTVSLNLKTSLLWAIGLLPMITPAR